MYKSRNDNDNEMHFDMWVRITARGSVGSLKWRGCHKGRSMVGMWNNIIIPIPSIIIIIIYRSFTYTYTKIICIICYYTSGSGI